jgi:hypothetical protein
MRTLALAGIVALFTLHACTDPTGSAQPEQADADISLDAAKSDVDSGSTDAGGDVGSDDVPAPPSDADASEEDGDTGDAPDAPTCVAGERRCEGDDVLICQGGAFVVEQVCLGGTVCIDGACLESADCEPFAVEGCASIDARKVCNAEGTAYVPTLCNNGEQCVDGACATVVCTPSITVCDSATRTKTCLPDGSAYGEPEECKPGASCIGGKCLSACDNDVKLGTNVGCAFWTLDLGQWEVKPGDFSVDKSVEPIPHAVVVANPSLSATNVTFETQSGATIVVDDPVVPGGSVRAFEMPVLSVQDSAVTLESIRLTTDRPVIAAQFNPLNNVGAYSNDASLLLPEPALGTEYVAVTLPSMKSPPAIKSPSVWGYVTVVAVFEGTTTVTVVPSAPTEAGPELPSFPAGEPVVFELERWEVLNLNALATTAGTHDMTGTVVTADQPVAAFSGHQCMSVGETCDHLETQLLPVSAWGNAFVAVSSIGKTDLFRVVSGTDGNVVTAIPPTPGLSGAELDKGEWVEVSSASEFQVSGTGPLQVVQFLKVADPSMSALVPTDRYLKDYPVLVPSGFADNWLLIVRNPGAQVLIDEAPVIGSVATVGIGMWERVQVSVTPGVHRLTSTEPFGVMLYGFDTAVSYFVPGGMATGE